MRNNVVKMAKLKHDLNAAPAYAYYFTWQTPILDGLPARGIRRACVLLRQHQALRAGHRQHARGAGAGEEDGDGVGELCGDRQSQQPGVTWEPTDPETNKTMVWDNESRMVDDPEGEARKIILS